MGTFYKYKGGYAIEQNAGLAIASYTSAPATQITMTFKDTEGTDRNRFAYNNNYDIARAMSIYPGWVPVSTADSTYTYSDYEIVPVGTITKTVTYVLNNDNVAVNMQLTISNSDSSDITVSCIKFKQTNLGMYTPSGTLGYKELLVAGYFLENPITIPANDSRTITLSLLFDNM